MSSRDQKMRRFTGNVPEEMVTNILLRLDAKTLVGLKSVSKTWLALISSPHFAKSHLAITAAEEEEQEVHVTHTYRYGSSGHIIGHSMSLFNLSTRQFITSPSYPIRQHSKIVGSACGIVCIHARNFGFGEEDDLYLWNPATNLYKLIPTQPCPPNSVSGALGFGFDDIDNDFKIVRFQFPGPCNDINYLLIRKEVCVEVYSAKKNAWKKVEQNAINDIFYHDNASYVSVEGGLLCFGGHYGVITFDLHTEVLNSPAMYYPVPTFKANINNYNFSDARATITHFNDSIAVIISKRIGYDDRGLNDLFDHKEYKLNLWALDDKTSLHGGGIQASWTLVYDIDVNLPLYRVHGYLNNIGDLLLMLYGKEDWCLYNPEKKEPRYFTSTFVFGEVFKYTKSLFTIPGLKQANAPFPKANE